MIGIGHALGARFRLLTLAWFIGAPVAAAIEIARPQDEDEGEVDWTDDANTTIDELAMRRGRKL